MRRRLHSSPVSSRRGAAHLLRHLHQKPPTGGRRSSRGASRSSATTSTRPVHHFEQETRSTEVIISAQRRARHHQRQPAIALRHRGRRAAGRRFLLAASPPARVGERGAADGPHAALRRSRMRTIPTASTSAEYYDWAVAESVYKPPGQGRAARASTGFRPPATSRILYLQLRHRAGRGFQSMRPAIRGRRDLGRAARYADSV